jgi:hypothetical protein
LEIRRCVISTQALAGNRFAYYGLEGNYDISKMHYDGPGNVPGAPGGGYGYDIRVEGRSSANPEAAPAAAPAVAAAA